MSNCESSLRRTAVVGAAAVAVAASAVSGCSTATPAAGPSGGPPAPTSASKSQLFSDDFRGVCQGATVSRATPYAAGSPHKVVLFAPYTGSVVEDTSTLPSDWMVQFDANTDNYAKIDTVACMAIKNEQPVKMCDGFQNEKGQPTANKVDLRTATYTVTAREATTGKVLGTTELVGTDDTCPTFLMFDNESQTKTYDAPPPTDALVAFLKPFVQP